MLTSMILGILTIVLALAFSLLHLAAAFSAMKEKNFCQGNKCIMVGSCLTSLALAIFFFIPLATVILWIVGSSIICYGRLLEWSPKRLSQYIASYCKGGASNFNYAPLYLTLA